MVGSTMTRLWLAGLAVLVIFSAGLGAGWLLQQYDRSRLFGIEAEAIAAVLELKPGVNAGDIRAGTGRWTVDMARRVGPAGQVYATAGPNPPHELMRTVAESGLDNVTVITRTPGASPRLPVQCCEAVLVRAVYHEFEDRQRLLQSLALNVRPGGRVAVIDFDEGTPEFAGRHGIARATVVAEFTAAGFELVEERPRWFGNAYCIVFRRPDSAASSR
jgi:predicted methyltransferase